MASEKQKTVLAPCPAKPALSERRLLSPAQARHLTSVFKILANDTRLRLLHALVKEQELGVNELAATVDMKPQAISNQLQKLATQGIVESRRNGNQILYRILDPCVPALLDQGLCLAEDAANRKR
jgi:ArsR family transcriptional regulator, lead/cadmium/zinc/bismuth-responsive transcriptional repressor